MSKRKDQWWVTGGGHTTGFPSRARAERVARQVKGAKVSKQRHGSGSGGCLILMIGSIGTIGLAVASTVEVLRHVA